MTVLSSSSSCSFAFCGLSIDLHMEVCVAWLESDEEIVQFSRKFVVSLTRKDMGVSLLQGASKLSAILREECVLCLSNKSLWRCVQQ